jgi:hypothetical protein
VSKVVKGENKEKTIITARKENNTKKTFRKSIRLSLLL